MRVLEGQEGDVAKKWLGVAARLAQTATCLRAKGGSVIISAKGKRIGAGVNTPPNGQETQRRCAKEKASYHPKVTDKTCCVHAEQRAIMDALRTSPCDIAGARLYYARLAEDGSLAYAGQPYCTICSKMALDVGVTEFVLWHETGIAVYSTEEYNERSFAYAG